MKGKHSIRRRTPEPSCARKETVDIDVLVKSRDVDRKIMQSISYQNNEWARSLGARSLGARSLVVSDLR